MIWHCRARPARDCDYCSAAIVAGLADSTRPANVDYASVLEKMFLKLQVLHYATFAQSCQLLIIF